MTDFGLFYKNALKINLKDLNVLKVKNKGAKLIKNDQNSVNQFHTLGHSKNSNLKSSLNSKSSQTITKIQNSYEKICCCYQRIRKNHVWCEVYSTFYDSIIDDDNRWKSLSFAFTKKNPFILLPFR